ncbi:alpha/beta fold hydrolase [Streptacidiphilus jiangxiensis]|uniref:Pimeloyl-ACP methyl ester carboxylesterase n=1 Tax=Streptacidiphilus jiangxiensis TaxID=235985 RepID=A0A1H7TIR6_STRJI|nr:alpha/beta fold hydrolase [Streptacidiphilus jiangxiensis]SEL84588.1 Pimeloyl-ACP methyl ester carboxylesterase [Streptacidiphilus jiangxiensis]
MATYTLVPGADGRAWYWHRLVPELRARGHRVITLDLPTESDAGIDVMAEAICGAVLDGGVRPGSARASEPLVLVAQSLAGFATPVACERLPVPVAELVLLNAMVPAPGETAGQWWENTGQPQARSAYAAAQGRGEDPEFDLREDFFHDVPPEVTQEALTAGGSAPPAALFEQPWPLLRWPDVPTRFLQGRDDRFFPLEFQRGVVRERLGLEVEEIPGGHLAALSRPRELADHLVRATG